MQAQNVAEFGMVMFKRPKDGESEPLLQQGELLKSNLESLQNFCPRKVNLV